MSTRNSFSSDSLSSSATNTTSHRNGQEIDPSNILYNDHENYQIIFTHDSRFFDTSLHLFKSYRKLGYIKSDHPKSRINSFFSSSKASSNVLNKPRNSKTVGFNSNFNVQSMVNGTIKQPYLKNHDFSTNHGSTSRVKLQTSRQKHDRQPFTIANERQLMSSKHYNRDDDSSDDSDDIIVTRL